MRRVVLALIATAACHAPIAAGQPGPARDPLVVTRLSSRDLSFSTFSGFTDSVRLVVRDSATWRDTWRTIHQPFIPPPPVPPIDFARDMVVVAALGARPSEGYEIVVENVREDSSGIEVALRVTEPARGCPVAAVMTQPVDLARISASARRVRFRQRTVAVPCGAR
jgi:hypothetical protein